MLKFCTPQPSNKMPLLWAVEVPSKLRHKEVEHLVLDPISCRMILRKNSPKDLASKCDNFQSSCIKNVSQKILDKGSNSPDSD